MKTLKNVFSVLTIVLAVAALVMYFVLPFGQINGDTATVKGVAAEFAFGSVADHEVGKSSDILFTMILSVLTVLFAGLSFKFKGTRWATIGFSAVNAVYMLVIGLSHSNKFIDTQGLVKVGTVNNGTTAYLGIAPLLIAIAIFLTLGAAVAYLLTADKLACMESAEPKLTIPQRLVKFLRDYKGEVKKITWPGFKTVVKNTVIVLIMCAVIGVFVWAIEYGLGALLNLIYK